MKNLGTLLAVTRLRHVEDYQSLYCSVSVSSVKYLDLEMFWSLELVGIVDPINREGDDEALEKLYEIINGRYQVTFPWKRDKSELPDNSKVAMRRMKSLVCQLEGDVSLLQSYDNVIQQQFAQEIIETVQDTNTALINTYYLPHHPVLTPSKSTTKKLWVSNQS